MSFVKNNIPTATQSNKPQHIATVIKDVANEIKVNISTEESIEYIVSYIERNQLDITDGYDNWLNIGFALVDALGENGRDYFHRISNFNSSYEFSECEDQYNKCLNSTGNGIRVNTLFHLAYEGGVPKKQQLEQQQRLVINFFIITIDKNGNQKISIDAFLFICFLKAMGFFRISTTKNERQFVRVLRNIIAAIEVDDIIAIIIEKVFKNYKEINGLTEQEMFNAFCSKPKFSSENFFAQLNPDREFKLMKDDKNTSFIFFKNGFLEIKDSGISFKDYSSMNGYIWEEQIIPHEFDSRYLENIDSIFDRSAFAKFIVLISEGYVNSNRELKQILNPRGNRIQALMSAIGYSLHGFFETKMKAIALTDSSLSDGANGRTGKTLVSKGIAEIRPTSDISGKDFQSSNNHRFQKIKRNDQVVTFNDLKNDFELESIYTGITEGYEVNPKGKQPYNVLAKTLITSNKTLRLDGSSDRDRVYEFEVTNYFSEDYHPEHEFGQWFFGKNWANSEWQYFFVTMALCLQVYLRNGLIKAQNPHLQLRKLKEETNREFLLWVQDQEDRLKFYGSNNTLESFVEEFPDYSNLAIRTFQKWCEAYANHIPDAEFRKNQRHEKMRGFSFKRGTPPKFE
ncbi:PriCT-2 domain-containing protein [Sediminitomix flava]|uniref:Primase-like protein n=1 Tax=Sediminitomix flava TaxID=379075 RepID=A0A315Z9N7_SEDFL|nr:PriCT-2 domain-containing protein [Sediminitomix flava]PWJ42231.1 primase-like protein [Sediminitomix flava]